MNLHRLLLQRQKEDRPIRVGLIGAGKFGSMYLAQAFATPGIHLMAIADLSFDRAVTAMKRLGIPPEARADSLTQAFKQLKTFITEDALSLIAEPAIDVIIEATGSPLAGVHHVQACCRQGKSIIMVNVEADALVGPALARMAKKAGIVYSLAYGDQPALICEQVDWARTCGFEVVAAGKGTKYLPIYHYSTPDTVWDYYGFSRQQVADGDFNPKMFNSFLDGTKSAIEMAAVANATGLEPARGGLSFPPCGTDDLPRILKPRSDGGLLEHPGQVEVVSSLERDGRPVFRDLRWGVYVTFTARSDYALKCFREYGLITDDSGRYSALYRPAHMIGLELGISVASVALRNEPTGAARDFVGDVAATAKRDLKPGDILDGEGGHLVYGTLLPARQSLATGYLPIGLAHHVKLLKPVLAGMMVKWEDVSLASDDEAIRIRRSMEADFCKEWHLDDSRRGRKS